MAPTIWVAFLFTFAVVEMFGYLISRRGLWAHVKTCEDKLGTTEDIVLRLFSYNELAMATNAFNQAPGCGSFGPKGTRGYLAPEWYQNKPISMKADIYSFGIVLLETVCCRKNIELQVEDDEIILTDWISKCYRAGELAKLFHGEEVEKKQFERIVMVGLWCIQSEPAFRPSMKNVILMIEGNMDVQVPPFPAS
ncbi:hypothetical protein AAC387_Pa04g1310 [Persea americana]